MSEHEEPRDGARRRRRIGATVAVLTLGSAGAALLARRADQETPPQLLGAPVRVATADGDAVYVLTTHDRRRVTYASRNSSRPIRVERYLDLWRFDPATAAPVWRRRLQTEVNVSAPVALGARLLGAHGGTLWLLAGGPRAVALTDGRPLGNADTIEARSPAIRGAMPTDARFVSFGGDGLRLLATDAQVHRVDPATLVAEPAPKTAVAGPPATRPAHWIGSSVSAFATRGLDIPGRWLGVMSAEEGEGFRRRVEAVAAALQGDRRERAYHEASLLAPPREGLEAPVRLRLWGARVDRVSAAPPDWPADMPNRWGTRAAYSDVQPLPESPEFLQGGLLHAGGTPAPPLLVREPDGVLVLHRDRLGSTGRLQLTRVAGPGGRAVWEARLPLSLLQSVLAGPPDRRTLVLVGREYVAGERTRRERALVAHEQIVGVDVATGAVRAYDLTALGPTAPLRP